MILYRYFFKNLLFSILSISTIFIGILLLTQSLRFIEILVAHTDVSSFKNLFKFFLFLLPDIIVLILPFSLVFSILFIYNRLLWDRELTIMRAIGVSNFKIALPAIGMGVVVAFFILILNLFVLPNSIKNLKDLEHTLKETTSISFIKEGEFNNFPGLTVYIREKNKKGEVSGIFAYAHPPHKPAYILIAEKGFLEKDPGSKLHLLLYNGIRQETNENTEKQNTLYFKQTIVSLKPEKKTETTRIRKIGEFSLKELFNPDSTQFTKVDILKMYVEGHSRILTPFLALSYALISVTVILLVPFRRTGFMTRIVITFGGILLLQVISLIFINLATKIPNLIWIFYAFIGLIIMFSFYFLKKVNYLSDFFKLNHPKFEKK
ncbi:MAG: LptF/LptG family permease [Proteobacteria bacterium]|nr:LptF/LptG family permease [Pseudomonadota bacterium]